MNNVLPGWFIRPCQGCGTSVEDLVETDKDFEDWFCSYCWVEEKHRRLEKELEEAKALLKTRTAALRTILVKAGNHTVADTEPLFAYRDDPGFTGIYAVAIEALTGLPYTGRITLEPEAFAEFERAILDPAPPSPALIDLFRRHPLEAKREALDRLAALGEAQTEQLLKDCNVTRAPALAPATPEGYPEDNEILERDAKTLLDAGERQIEKAKRYLDGRCASCGKATFGRRCAKCSGE